MTTASSFRVIIAGGGISGLTLANALEKAGIDYVLLEARDTIAPQVGASIGFFQNGARLLDQLGCLEAIWSDTCALFRGRNRDKYGRQYQVGDGIQLVEARYLSFSLIPRTFTDTVGSTGYPALFIERESALRIMYHNLRNKSTVQLQKRIDKVEHQEDAVIVTCTDGTSISGDVLVGCDGVHSVVRQEMWRLAHLHEQSSFDPSDKDLMFAEYKCMFGISGQTKGITDGEVTVNYDEGFSTLIIGGKQKVYWFMFKRLDKIW